MVAVERIVSISASDSAPMKRLVQDAKDAGTAIDATSGRRTKSVIITDSEHIVLSSLTPEALSARIENGDNELAAEEEVEA